MTTEAPTYHPSPADRAAIRAAAAQAATKAGIGRFTDKTVVIEIGERVAMKGDGRSINLLLICPNAASPFEGTDLHDPLPWGPTLDKGVPLTPKGDAVVDCYVYSRGADRELITNVQIRVTRGRLDGVTEGNRVVWMAPPPPPPTAEEIAQAQAAAREPELRGAIYCSKGCGFGCTKHAFDRATAEADALCARLGPGWAPRVWENWGWHYEAERGVATVSPRGLKHAVEGTWGEPDGYSAEVRIEGRSDEEDRHSSRIAQFFGKGDNPKAALAQALKRACTWRDTLTAEIEALRDD